MNALLTIDEYAAIAAKVTPPAGAFIDGAFRPAVAGRTFPTVNLAMLPVPVSRMFASIDG